MTLNVAVKNALVAAVYCLLAVTSLQFAYHASNATPVWPPSGFAFAILLLFGRKLTPGIFLGAVAANCYVFLDHQTTSTFTSIWVSLLIGAGNTLEALFGYNVLKRLVSSLNPATLFDNVSQVLYFVGTTLMMCAVSALIGGTASYLAGIISGNEYFWVFFTWWTGDISGILVLTPFLVQFFARHWHFKPIANRKKPLEAIAILSGIIAISLIVFHNWTSPPFILTRSFIVSPLVILAAVRLGQRMLSFSILVCATIALAGTMQGTGPFQGPTLHESLLTAEAFVSVSAVMALLLNAAIRERKEKEKSLQGARDNLEHLVQERTRELYEKNRQLEERNRELTSFSYAASHDLQEPLRKIGFFTSKVMESMPAGATNNFLDRIKSSVVRMQRLIENLLSYSLIENNNKLFTETNLNEILRDVKNDLSESLQQTGAMVDAAPLPVVHAIPFQMEQLFTNILQNAIKFRKENTSPHILIEWHLNGDGNYFHLRFTDDGIGFEPENAGRIFELLQKLHGQSEYEGTGIGLAICKKIVEEHGGTIEAKGAVGKGCTIEAVFPAAMMIREASLDREEMEKESAV